MEKISITKEEVVKRINAQLGTRQVFRYTATTLEPRVDENPNWEVSGHGVSGPNMLSADEKAISDKVEKQFSNFEVD
jgi:hypothetical protein